MSAQALEAWLDAHEQPAALESLKAAFGPHVAHLALNCGLQLALVRDALVSLHVAALLFGFAGLFGKWLVLPPAAIVLGRTAVAAVALVEIARTGEPVT